MTRIRIQDEHGLCAAGYGWREPCRWRSAALYAAVGIMGIVGAQAGASIKAPHATTLSMLGWIGLACLSVCGTYALWRIRFRPRSLIFHLDGSMEMPHGLPGFFQRFHIGGHHDNIVTIERIVDDAPEGQGRLFRAALYSRGGDIIRLSRPVHPDAAHRIAVQLTRALHELRAARAEREEAAHARKAA